MENWTQETAAIITGEGGSAEAHRADVTDQTQVEALVARTVSLWGGIDVLHNNVGIVEAGGPVETGRPAGTGSWRSISSPCT